MEVEIKYYRVTDKKGHVSRGIGYVYTRDLVRERSKYRPDSKDTVMVRSEPVRKVVEDKPKGELVEEITLEEYQVLAVAEEEAVALLEEEELVEETPVEGEPLEGGAEKPANKDNKEPKVESPAKVEKRKALEKFKKHEKRVLDFKDLVEKKRAQHVEESAEVKLQRKAEKQYSKRTERLISLEIE